MHLSRTVKDDGVTKRVDHLVIYDQLPTRIVPKRYNERSPHIFRVGMSRTHDVVIDMNRRKIEIGLNRSPHTL